jgi:hypothetical protein
MQRCTDPSYKFGHAQYNYVGNNKLKIEDNELQQMANTVFMKILAIRSKSCRGPQCSWRLRLPEFLDIPHMKVVRLSVLHTGRLYPFPRQYF